MNKPIRTISVFCLLLFLGLMLNATYLQYWRAGDLNEDPRNRRVLAESFSSERGAILVGEAGQGRTAIAESEPSGDQYDYQRTYPQPFKYAHLTGWFSYFSQTGIEFTQEIGEIFEFRGGKVVRVRDFLTHAEALEAAGLSE